MLTQSTEEGGRVHVGLGTAVSSLAVAGCLIHGCGDLVFFGTTSIIKKKLTSDISIMWRVYGETKLWFGVHKDDIKSHWVHPQ